jgi:hypothetical protein
MTVNTNKTIKELYLKWIASILIDDYSSTKLQFNSDWDYIITLAEEHGVLALLNQKLSVIDYIPETIKEAYKRKTWDIIAQDLIRSQELASLFKTFAENNINFMVFKGGALAYSHYQESYLRVRCDTDILFQNQRHAEQAWAILKQLGYSKSNTLTGSYVGFQFCCIKPLKSRANHVLDCHIKFNDHLFYAKTLTFDILKQQAIFRAEPFPMLTPCDTHAALIALMHRTTTLSSGQPDRLIWLYDIYLLLSQFTDQQWLNFTSLAKDKKICGTCLDGINKTMQFFPLNTPSIVISEFKKLSETEPFNPSVQHKRWFYYYHSFKEVDGIGNKIGFIKEHFLPSKKYIMNKYNIRSPFLLPFFYILRIITGLKRYF